MWVDYQGKEGRKYDRKTGQPIPFPYLTIGVLDSLEKSELIISRKSIKSAKKSGPNKDGVFQIGHPKYENRRIITLQGEIYKAVDTKFGEVEAVQMHKAGAVFINYRRADTEAYAGRIYDNLSAVYGEDSIYMDVDDLPLGEDFDDELEVALDECKGFIAVIGPKWLTITDATGSTRLFTEDDFVRREIKRALNRDIKFFPILVGGAKMPAKDELPDDIAQLSRKQASSLDHKTWGADIHDLVEDVGDILKDEIHKDNFLSLGLFKNVEKDLSTELSIVETSNSRHAFGIGLINSNPNLIFTGILIDIYIEWDGNDPADSRYFETQQSLINKGWEMIDGDITQISPAHLKFNSPDINSAKDHDIRWNGFHLTISKPQKLIGAFNINYKITTVSPRSISSGNVVLKLN